MNDKSYKNWVMMTDKSLLEVIGNFIQKHRINQNKTQDEVAKAAALSRSTLSLLERGEKVRIDSLIQVLRVLDLLHVMDAFHIEEQISPIEYAKWVKKQRKKASPKKNLEESKDDLGW